MIRKREISNSIHYLSHVVEIALINDIAISSSSSRIAVQLNVMRGPKKRLLCSTNTAQQSRTGESVPVDGTFDGVSPWLQLGFQRQK
jgi:hypothetical protein